MSIGTYQELQVAIVNWLTKPEHVGRVTELISLFEAKVKRELRVRQMESRSTAPTEVGTAALALPSDFLEMRNLRLNTSPKRTLQMLPPNTMDIWYGAATLDTPRAYKIVGSEIVFAPAPDAVVTVEMDYYSFAVLSTSATTNWLLTAYPDAYLFGSLAQVIGLGTPDPRAVEWNMKSRETLEEIKDSDLGARWAGSPLVSRPDFVTP